ncbi:peptide/nickel transport system permease protein/oligopeptide transport system permease protein [Hydrogenispora ethanolica]|jgi:peptide/nickel transport system permease protein/oligopeptide transport system permease protein|uniref:Peptide/nickel transport system permease protein/oligopeptide transport system permease protein n=1 Tax=Hydrogenispora ethanolica TaxID=1082276 RepID=A0A4R1S0J4_HYDET|nr:ABC transporter permease [Hydrogenispora ethanolica]TCL72439.1 peptide/nickel transport system permease protein/oligopeptide transport system permease protein [Hydrogenispora ethanolica]
MSVELNTELKTAPVEESSPWRDFWKRFSRNKVAMVGLTILVILILVSLFGQWLAPYDYKASNMPESLQPPSAAHWLGTDELGRDILSRIIYGTHISLKVGIEAVLISLLIGIVFGAAAGYYGGVVDHLLMRLMDIMLAFPPLLLAITFMAALGRGLDNAIIAIGIVSIPEYARIVRGSVMSVKENDYVQAARAIGNNDFQVIFHHVIPNVTAPIIVRATLGFSAAILEAAMLGFLGLGVQPPEAEWGAMLGSGRSAIFSAPHIVTFPGIAITVTVLAFNLLGDGLRDALDPRMKQ